MIVNSFPASLRYKQFFFKKPVASFISQESLSQGCRSPRFENVNIKGYNIPISQALREGRSLLSMDALLLVVKLLSVTKI